ncbi:MAG TPA: penicillin-insensitive murein endopeptidase [Solirubrobacterales bacterium]|nr:penicillin-insensitive murein endopeptidase [Solirubrobacterales bacterium]
MRPRQTSLALALAVPVLAAMAALWLVQPLAPAGGGAPKTAEQSAKATPGEKARSGQITTPGEVARPDGFGVWRSIRWRRSQAIGLPHAGRLLRGVRLPAEGAHFFTWDPIHRRSPNRAWRRWGTDNLVRATLRVVHAHAAAHPGAPRVGIGDLSRPHGGDFGPQFGAIGHATHQSGLDVDVYYPLRSGAERAPLSVDEVDLVLAQDLVDRFVRAGAVKVYVGPSTGLSGPPGVVEAIPLHDNHLHARLSG